MVLIWLCASLVFLIGYYLGLGVFQHKGGDGNVGEHHLLELA